MATPRLLDFNEKITIIGVAELEELFWKKREEARRAIVGEERIVSRRGFVDTTKGLVLTTDAAIAAAKEMSERYHQKKLAAARKAELKKIEEKLQIERSERSRWAVRAKYAGKTVEEYRNSVRSLPVRREIARSRTRSKRMNAQNSHDVEIAELLFQLEERT